MYRLISRSVECDSYLAASSATGAPKNTYRANEYVCAACLGFATGTNAKIHVVRDQD